VNNRLKLPMKGLVDFFLGLAVLIVGVVLLFLAFLSVRNEQSLLVEAVRQSRDTARLASAQDVGNTSVVQCRQRDDLQAAAEALYNAFSQIWGSEGLLVGLGVLGDSQSWTFFCGPNECGDPQEITPQITQCFERFGQTNDESFGYFVGGAFGNFCGIFENNNRFIGEGGDNPPLGEDCDDHEDCEPTQYCYLGRCYNCPNGYKRKGVRFAEFWFSRNFRLASIYKLFFSLLQAESMGTEEPGNPPASHPFCEPCSEEDGQPCIR
jgi:heme exporter protein D